MEGQGTSIHALTGGKTYVTLAVQSDGSYQAYGTYAKVKLYLKDDSDPDKEAAELKPNSKSEKAMNWWAHPVDTDKEYLGILPDVEAGGKYYGTIKASFPFKLASSGMKAYVVTERGGSGFTVQEDQQAYHFIKTVDLENGDLPPVLDVEHKPISQF